MLLLVSGALGQGSLSQKIATSLFPAWILPLKIRPSSTFMKQLQIWNEVEYNIWDLKGIPKSPYQVYLDGRAMILKSKGLTGDEPIAPVDL